MNLVTAHDYTWIRPSPLFRHAMESGYTLTLIRGRTPREVLRAMETEPRGIGEGTAGLIEADDAHRAEVDYDWDNSYVAGAFRAPGENGDWTILGFDGGWGSRVRACRRCRRAAGWRRTRPTPGPSVLALATRNGVHAA
ncbi:DUF6461 domain-containing protein [Streptomyces sp. NPDC048514]|uniref:DUF6461 domain-containing protein n=1 Tax=Streptomyces sp. NPDC048514 TaxID=3365564 RepID=UPI0037176130